MAFVTNQGGYIGLQF